MNFTAPGKVLAAWDMGQGPSFDADARTKELGEVEVWRSTTLNGSDAVMIGTTEAEAFLDTDVTEGGCYCYFFRRGGVDIGPFIDVEVPYANADYADVTAPSEVDEVTATGVGNGILLSWQPASDDESGVLAYFVSDSNQDQPDSVVWANEAVKAGSGQLTEFRDVIAAEATKSYAVSAIDCALNISDFSDAVTETAGSDETTLGYFVRFEVKVDQDNSDPDVSQFTWRFGGTNLDYGVTPGVWHSVWLYVERSMPETSIERSLIIAWVGTTPGYLHLRRCRSDQGFDPGGNPDPGYFDGDSSGWEWDGDAHDSTSSESGGTRRNLFTNPTFHVNYTDGWELTEGVYPTSESDAVKMQLTSSGYDAFYSVPAIEFPVSS